MQARLRWSTWPVSPRSDFWRSHSSSSAVASVSKSSDNPYMFPRRDGILLGGTFERENWSLEPDPNAAERILNGHAHVFGRMRT